MSKPADQKVCDRGGLGSQEPAIRIRCLKKAYPIYDKPVHRLVEALTRGRKRLHKEFWALKGVDLDIHKGTCLGIVGKNGSGKSTLLQILAGTLRATEGEVQVNGRVAALLELGAGFDTEFTGRENVYNYGMTLGMRREQVAERYESILDFSEIGAFAEQPVKTYSSGMFMRLAFAVAVHVDPDILIVDEALSVGDFKFQQKCLDRMHKFKEEGKTIIVVSHSLGVIQNYCDNALWLVHGEQVAFDDAELVARYYFNDFDCIPAHLDQDDHPRLDPGSDPTPEEKIEWNFEAEDSERAKTLDFEIVNDKGKRQSSFLCRDSMKVRWRVRVTEPIQKPNIGLCLELADLGSYVFSASARGDGFRVDEFKDIVDLEFDLPDLRLLRGKYMLRVTITNERGMTMYARVNQILEMDHKGLEWGIIRLDLGYRVNQQSLVDTEQV